MVKQPARKCNSYDAVRFIAATAVLISHHYPLSGRAEPVVPRLQTSLGGASVAIFFSISGFLVYRSACLSSDVASYIVARTLRIFPGLAVSVTITTIAMLLFFSNFGNYYQHIRFILHNSFSFLQPVLYNIPGVLDGRPNTSLNGSLWTLQYEFFFYFLALVVSMLFTRLRLVSMLAVVVVLGAASGLAEPFSIGTFQFDSAATFSRLGKHFLSGMIVYAAYGIIQSSVSLSLIGSILGMTISYIAFGPMSFVFIFFFTVVLVIFCESPLLSKWAGLGDPSYGVYIYAFPIQQIAIIVLPGFYASMVVSGICAIAFGFASWHLLEKRCLKLKYHVAAMLRRALFLLGHDARNRDELGVLPNVESLARAADETEATLCYTCDNSKLK